VVNKNVEWNYAIEQEQDNILPTEPECKWKADFDFGLEYNTERFQAGLSVRHLSKRANDAHRINMGQHFYGYLRYNFPRKNNFSLSATAFAQNSKKSTHIESNLVLFYRRTMWVGAGYRCDEKLEPESLVGMIGVNLLGFLKLGYSFDFNIGKIGKYSNNTHEIMLGIKISRRR
jgi:type IX secretion system PorP/SprF family membrane protein